MADGAKSVADGASQLNQGIVQLSDGATAINDGAAQLSDGTKKLHDLNWELASTLLDKLASRAMPSKNRLGISFYPS